MMYLFERLEAVGMDGLSLETAVGLQLSRLVAVHDWELPPGLGESLGLGLPSAPDLGRDGGRDLEHYAERLEQVIRRHEPRLVDPKVKVESNGPHLPSRIVVEAMLAYDDGPQPFRFTLPDSGSSC